MVRRCYQHVITYKPKRLKYYRGCAKQLKYAIWSTIGFQPGFVYVFSGLKQFWCAATGAVQYILLLKANAIPVIIP